MAQRQFFAGDPVPWFTCKSTSNPRYNFDTVAGRYIVLSFLGSAAHPASAEVLNHVTTTLRPHFDDEKIAFFGVSVDPEDERAARVAQMLPGIRYFFDVDRKVSEAYGAVDGSLEKADGVAFRPFTLVLDPLMRVIANLPLAHAKQHNDQLGQLLGSLPPVDSHGATEICAPILSLPRVFEPEFCAELIKLYEQRGRQGVWIYAGEGGQDCRRHGPRFQAAEGLRLR